MENVWNKIPLKDYEFHMQHNSVGQLHLLNDLTKKYLEKIHPKTVLFLGIAGGNGLEHINNNSTTNVFGIDINQNYLDETKKRFNNKISNLTLLNLDISSSNTIQLTKANLVWAALIFEYVEIDKCFEFITNNIQYKGYLVVTIQVNNGVNSVSQTGVETIKSVGEIFQLIEPKDLLSFAEKFGFVEIDFEENILPNKKSLKTYTFIKK
nr:hypothetical protein [uncultured Flavobacterium sp.]